MILLFCWDCSTLPDLTVFDLFTDNNKSLCPFRADEKAARSLHYKLPGRQNKPNDGASHGQRALQQPVGGFRSRVTLHLSMLPLPCRLLAQ